MGSITEKKEKEHPETLIVKNEVLTELAGNELEKISETRILIMEEYDRIQIENLISYHEKIEEERAEYEQIYEENRLLFQDERIQMQKGLVKQLEEMIQDTNDLMELNRKEKATREVIDEIFEVIRNWTDIDFIFSQLLGMREALKTVEGGESDSSDPRVAKLVSTIKCRMMSRVHVMQALHKSNKKMLDDMLKSIDEFLDFVELGTDNVNRTGIVIVLNSMKNVPFWTLKNEKLVDEGIDNIRETILEIRDLLFQLPLCQLRPRKSIRQTLWDEIDSFSMLNDISVNFENLRIE